MSMFKLNDIVEVTENGDAKRFGKVKESLGNNYKVRFPDDTDAVYKEYDLLEMDEDLVPFNIESREIRDFTNALLAFGNKAILSFPNISNYINSHVEELIKKEENQDVPDLFNYYYIDSSKPMTADCATHVMSGASMRLSNEDPMDPVLLNDILLLSSFINHEVAHGMLPKSVTPLLDRLTVRASMGLLARIMGKKAAMLIPD